MINLQIRVNKDTGQAQVVAILTCLKHMVELDLDSLTYYEEYNFQTFWELIISLPEHQCE